MIEEGTDYPARPRCRGGDLGLHPANSQPMTGPPASLEIAMTNRSTLVDEFARLVTDAAGMAAGMRREVDTVVRTQLERLLASMDAVNREEFEAVKEMAARARDENDKLAARIAELEAKLAGK